MNTRVIFIENVIQGLEKINQNSLVCYKTWNETSLQFF